MDQKTKRTWISIAIAAVVIVVFLIVSVVAGAVFFFRRHVETHYTSDTAAIGEFDRERARFAGQMPLIELRPNFDGAIIHRRTAANGAPLQSLRILAFDPEAGKVIRISIPFWLLRLAPSKHFTLSDFDGEGWSKGEDSADRPGTSGESGGPSETGENAARIKPEGERRKEAERGDEERSQEGEGSQDERRRSRRWKRQDMHLTVHDLERAGPGLVLDAHGRRDGQLVLVWTE